MLGIAQERVKRREALKLNRATCVEKENDSSQHDCILICTPLAAHLSGNKLSHNADGHREQARLSEKTLSPKRKNSSKSTKKTVLKIHRDKQRVEIKVASRWRDRKSRLRGQPSNEDVADELGFGEEERRRGGNLPSSVAATFRPKGLFFRIYKFKFYTKTDFFNFHAFLCDFEK